MQCVVSIRRKAETHVGNQPFSSGKAVTGDRGIKILAQNPSLRTKTANRRQNPDSYCLRAADIQKSAAKNTTELDPTEQDLRNTPRGWLPSNVRSKDHPGFVLIGNELQVSPFLIGVYDLGMGEIM